MEEMKRYLETRIKHASSRVQQLKEAHGCNPRETHSYHGGWNLGYWEGKLSTYEDLLDELSHGIQISNK